jgi:hypothetical protein
MFEVRQVPHANGIQHSLHLGSDLLSLPPGSSLWRCLWGSSGPRQLLSGTVCSCLGQLSGTVWHCLELSGTVWLSVILSKAELRTESAIISTLLTLFEGGGCLCGRGRMWWLHLLALDVAEYQLLQTFVFVAFLFVWVHQKHLKASILDLEMEAEVLADGGHGLEVEVLNLARQDHLAELLLSGLFLTCLEPTIFPFLWR